MAENQEKKFQTKNQHYVPQFYMRNFSNDGIHINLYNIKNDKTVLGFPCIKKQCSEDYFYGDDGSLEKVFGVLETQFALLFGQMNANDVNDEKNIERINKLLKEENIGVLLLFAALQKVRTKDGKEGTEKAIKALLRTCMEMEGHSYGEDLWNAVQISGLHKLLIVSAISAVNAMLDLECCFFSNESLNDFIFSDAPIVFQNPLCEEYGYRGVGFASKGLIVLFPLSSKYYCCFYDKAVYSFSKKIIPLKSPSDIFQLNLLQLCSAKEQVFFQNKTFDINALVAKYRALNKKFDVQTELLSIEGTSNKMFHAAEKMIKNGFKISAFKIKRDALKCAFENKNNESYFSSVRDSMWIYILEEFDKAVKSGKYTIGELRKFYDENEKKFRLKNKTAICNRINVVYKKQIV